MNDKISSEDLEEQISATDPDTEKLRAKLSKLIENHHLDAKDKMDTLVRLSASVINALKRDMPNQSTKDGVEKVYKDGLYLYEDGLAKGTSTVIVGKDRVKFF